MSVSTRSIYALVKFAIFHVAWDVEIADAFTRARYRRVSILVACGRGKNGFVIVNYNAESHRRSLLLSLSLSLSSLHSVAIILRNFVGWMLVLNRKILNGSY